jgi:hypothetical protein
LNARLESLKLVESNENQSYISKKYNLIQESILLEKQIQSITDSIQSTQNQLKLLDQEFEKIRDENIHMKNESKSLEDSIYFLRKSNSKIELISPPSFSINENDLIDIITLQMNFTCPEEDLVGNTGPEICIEEVSSIQYFKYQNAIRLFGSVGFSFLGSHADVGNNGFILMEYKGLSWEIIDFFEYYDPDAMQWGNAMKIKEIKALGKNSIGFFFELCTTAAGSGPFCSIYIIGFNKDNIQLLFSESSKEDESYGFEKKGFRNEYSVIESNSEWYLIERTKTDFQSNLKIKSKLSYDQTNMRFE